MKVSIHVATREYPESDSHQAVVIAETLHPPFAATVAQTRDEAVAQLREALVRYLERSHPKLVKQLGTESTPRMSRTSMPLFESAHYHWAESGESWEVAPLVVEAEVDVVTTRISDELVRVYLPLWRWQGAWTVVRPGAEERALSDLADLIRPRSEQLSMHRPPPSNYAVETIDLDFEPLDLKRVDVGAVWQSEFADEDLEDFSVDAVPATPFLDGVAQDWSGLAPAEADERGIVETFGRSTKVTELRDLLESHRPAAVVLVGPPRVGKTALVKHVAHLHVGQEGRAPHPIWFADPPRMVSTDGMTMDWRQQCQEIVAELQEIDGILYMGRLIEALDAGKYVGSDYNLAQFLKPVLADHGLRTVAEATAQEWNEIERRDIGFARAFTVIRLEDPPENEGLAIVRRAIERLGRREGVVVTSSGVERAWTLQQRFAQDGSTVGRTIDFVRRAMRTAANALRDMVDEASLVDEFCRASGLPPILLHDDRQLDVERVVATLSARVMGQAEAVRRVADVVGITKAGLSSPDKPLGSFLFVGPTGVGKTELAKALAAYLFGDESRLVRIDMSEYGHADAYARLIGEGRDEGDLTGPVRRQPFSVVLLDEIEKAHPGVFDLLLQVLGEARLTDVNGRTTGFRNTIVIMTSNLGVDSLRPAIGFGDAAGNGEYAAHFRREAERFFRPEFLARIDQFIPFNALSEDVVEQIAVRELAKLSERVGLRAQDVELSLDERVAAWVAARGWDPRYGARPLKRVVEREVVGELSRRLATTRELVKGGASRRVEVTVPRGSVRKVGLAWDVRIVSGQGSNVSARNELLDQIEQITSLRRRLQRYLRTAVFGDLEWRVENFDLSSQAQQFWEDPSASTLATDAERARRVVVPAREITQELAALEDLAAEAYHGRTFALSDDLMDRLEELTARTGAVIMEMLRGAYHDPDRSVLALTAQGAAAQEFRAKLVQWYRKRAKAHGWDFQIWRSLPQRELAAKFPDPGDGPQYDENRVAWERTDEPQGEILALEIRGYAARPLGRAEHGLHRLISAEGNAVVNVIEGEEYAAWPWPWSVTALPTQHYVARTYNARTREISMESFDGLKFDPDDPFAAIESEIEDVVWDITEDEWA